MSCPARRIVLGEIPRRCGDERPPLFIIYRGWFITNYQEVFIFPEELKRFLHVTAPTVLEMGRTLYFNTVLPSVKPDTPPQAGRVRSHSGMTP